VIARPMIAGSRIWNIKKVKSARFAPSAAPIRAPVEELDYEVGEDALRKPEPLHRMSSGYFLRTSLTP
jgi:hypothetical protein